MAALYTITNLDLQPAFRKNPADILDYTVDVTDWLPSGDSASTYTWVVPAPLLLISEIDSGNTSTAFIGGGQDQNRYLIQVEVVTSGGRTKVTEFDIAVYGFYYAPGSYQYYVDPIHGNDSNNGLSATTAWLTTSQADDVTLTGSQSVGYLYGGVWYLYRSLNMTANEAQLAASLVTAPATDF